jgi:chromosome segregation ATPase
MHTDHQLGASITRADSPRPQTISSELAQGEVNGTAEFIADLQVRLSDVNGAIEDHERALSSLSTRRSMIEAALSQLESEAKTMPQAHIAGTPL